ncbi:hypothetical protein GGX14DRAFT_446813 [Mycena pura]|uniref:Secreted protein n=1 Tax=Mycena pura TaxID=153505 RepID=A0AAD6VIR4_9AGAR|nr:hypothetical protein GGX14DRAFT_446813 [Mycena pura]
MKTSASSAVGTFTCVRDVLALCVLLPGQEKHITRAFSQVKTFLLWLSTGDPISPSGKQTLRNDNSCNTLMWPSYLA